jgi:hypothetical protein
MAEEADVISTSMRARATLVGALTTVAVVIALFSAATVAARADSDVAGSRGKPGTVAVDVAENGTKFVIDEAPVFPEDKMPAYGNPFLTQGYIYPAGTLNGSNGVNPDGSPQFPDKVIGQWLCRGYFIGDGAHTKKGAWVYSTQLFAFGAQPDSGDKTLVVVGYEGSEVDVPVIGAITGGTGEYATARGAATQKLLGINNPELPTMGINKRVSFEIHR